MESQDELLLIKIRLCMSRNIVKLVLAVFGMGFLMSVSSVPITLFGALRIPLLFVFGAIAYIVQYGFFVLVLRLYHEQQTGLGHLFAGFYDFKRAFLVGIFFTLISVVVMFLFALVSSFGMSLFMVFILFAILAIFSIRYGLAWFLLYEQPDLKVREALKQSALITKGERRNFIWFCMKSAGYYLLISVLALVVVQIFSISNNSNNILITPLTVTYGICSFVSFMRISIAFAAWYTSHNDSIVIVDNTSDTVIELSEPGTDDSSENTED